jgi:hypothetical protein
MYVVGVLNSSHTPDDRAVFVDIKTAWVIAGLGHGHTDLATTTDQQNILEQRDGTIVASAKVVQYTEITPDNIDSWHNAAGVTPRGEPLSPFRTALRPYGRLASLSRRRL